MESSAEDNDEPAAPPPPMSQEELYAMQKAARERIRRAMGGNPHEARNGFGAAFGLGVDDEDYGYGPTRAEKEVRDLWEDEDSFAPAPWDDVVGAGGAERDGGGFDGRAPGWSRKAEVEDANPPLMANTLKGPAPGARPAQSFAFNFDSAREDVRKLDELDAQEEEAELLDALMGKPKNATAVPKGAYDSMDFWHVGS